MALIHSDQAIQNLFHALEGVFPENTLRSRGLFEDVPATMLETEFSDDARFGDLPEIVRGATAR